MDGRYRLRHPTLGDRATLAVDGATLRAHVPPSSPSVRSLATHVAALAAMNEELVRLTSKGWSLEDVGTGATEEEEEPEENADQAEVLDAETTSFERGGARLVVDAGKSTVTADQALGVLLEGLATGCRELVIRDAQEYEPPWYQTVEPWCIALGQLGSRALERLVIDTYFQPLSRQASVYCGDLTPVFRACPALRFAYVIGCAAIHTLAHEHLEDLTLMGEPLERDTVRAVFRGPLPRLSRLAIGLAYEGRPDVHADRAIVHGLTAGGLPALTELYIANPRDGAALLADLVASPAFTQLRVLSIDGDVFAQERRALKTLAKHKGALSKLERLELPIEDVLSKTDEDLTKMIPCLRGLEGLGAFRPERYGASSEKSHSS